MKKTVLIFLFLFSFQSVFALSYKNITVQEAFMIQRAKGENVLILDVRTPQEYYGFTGHVKNSVLIPVQVLDRKLHDIRSYKEKEVLVICNSGNRSKTASMILLQNGFKNVTNVLGGIQAWISAGLPTAR